MEFRRPRQHLLIGTGDFLVALAGNPNAGKTTIFNAVTGQHQHVGNYPGVTVDKKSGYAIHNNRRINFVDLPGTYSLSAYSLEEVVARDFVLRDKPDLIVDVIDSSNLKRNLYLLLQLQELDVPIMGVLNMADEVEKAGLRIDETKLSALLGIPLVKTVGNRDEGIEQLMDVIASIATGEITSNGKTVHYGNRLEAEREKVVSLLNTDPEFARIYYTSWMAIKLLEDDEDALEKVRREHGKAQDVIEGAANGRRKIETMYKDDPSVVIGEQRYAYINGITRQAVQKIRTPQDRINVTERVDRIVLNRYAGVFIFFLIMFLVYQFTFALGNPLSDLVDHGFARFGLLMETILPQGVIQDLVVNGIIGGVGGVLVFFPLVMFLFLGLSFLEDTGYMARAAFVMDKFFQIFGLHGRSFIPFMIATGCAVPAVMSARTLSNRRDRTITIMVIPLMICGAKSPVIAMLAAAFFPTHAGLVFWLIWLASWLLAVFVALILTKVMFKGRTAPFVMELPPYRMPTWRSVFNHMWSKSIAYVKKAGTIILGASMVIWFLLSFPRLDQSDLIDSDQTSALTTHLKSTTVEVSALQSDQISTQKSIEYSYAGRIGQGISFMLEPAGFDWRIGISLFAGFAAKEVIISTMGIVYGIGEADPDAEGVRSERTPLKRVLAEDPAYSPAMALAMMIFVMIYLPCISVLAVVKKELGSWFWPAFQAAYTLVVAWVLAVITYQVGLIFGLG